MIKCYICQKQHNINDFLKCNDLFTNIIGDFLIIDINQYINELNELKIVNKIKLVEKNKNKYKCEKCNKILSSYTNYKKHITSKICIKDHDYKCNKCNKILNNKQSLEYHIKYSVCKKNINSTNNSTNIQTQNNDNSITNNTTNIQTLNNQNNQNIINITLGNTKNIKKVIEMLPFRNAKYNISPKKYLEYAKHPERAIKTFIKDEHFNPKKPERMNIHNTNSRSNKVQVLDQDEYNDCRWLTRTKADINELLYDRGVNHLYVAKNILEANGIFLDIITQRRLNDKIKEYETDDKSKKQQISMISDLTYDYRDLVDLNKKQTKLQIKN